MGATSVIGSDSTCHCQGLEFTRPALTITYPYAHRAVSMPPMVGGQGVIIFGGNFTQNNHPHAGMELKCWTLCRLLLLTRSYQQISRDSMKILPRTYSITRRSAQKRQIPEMWTISQINGQNVFAACQSLRPTRGIRFSTRWSWRMSSRISSSGYMTHRHIA